MNYLLLKYVHILCVAVSFSLFCVRGLWMMKVYPPATERWVQVLPYVVDALLLASAIGMVAMSPLVRWPLWIQAKIALLVVFVALAVASFRIGRGRVIKGSLWLVAALLFLFITTVAVLKEPSGLLMLIS